MEYTTPTIFIFGTVSCTLCKERGKSKSRKLRSLPQRLEAQSITQDSICSVCLLKLSKYQNSIKYQYYDEPEYI